MFTTDDVVTPKGRLDLAVLYPGVEENDATDKVDAFLQQGYQKAAAVAVGAQQDEAARQWAYHRAWDEVYQRLLAMPSSVAGGEGESSSYLLTQIEHIGELAAGALEEFELLAAIVAGVAAVERNVSQAKRLNFEF